MKRFPGDFTRQEKDCLFCRCKPWNSYRPFRGHFGCREKHCKYIGRCNKYEYLCETWKW